MKFTILSHACVYIEHADVRLLIDPWLVGSCYWRSWWNYPKFEEDLINKIKPTHIYITHLHWDHFHGPSLRKFHKIDPIIILPKHFNERMKNDFEKDFRFSEIIEIDHGNKKILSKNFQITSYQFNPIIIDSSLVIEADNVTLLNVNDSKTFGFSLNQIINNHPRFDFVFRSHSSASPIPHCINGVNVDDTDRSPSDYANDFIAFAKATKTKNIVPFASSHIFLHKDTEKFNKFYSNPDYVKKKFDQKIKNNQNCILMPSGSSWSKKNGFHIKKHDYKNLINHINDYKNVNKEKLSKQYSIENKQYLNHRVFLTYFKRFLKSACVPINLLNFKFAFLINEKKTNKIFLCIVNGIKKYAHIVELNSEKQLYDFQLAFVIKTPVYVFNDCNLKVMHNSFTPSKLLEIILISPNARKYLGRYLSLVDFYENDCLPFAKLLSLRNIIIATRRWREFLDVIFYLIKIKLKKQKIYQLYSEL